MAETVPQRCADHSATEAEILVRICMLEENMKEIKKILRSKADEKDLIEIVEKTEKQIHELKEEISRIHATNVIHGETLSGILEILKSLRDSQELMRTDYALLKDCYNQASVHIASVTAILAERARVEGSRENQKTVVKEVSEVKTPWYGSLFSNLSKSKVFMTAVIAFLTTIVYTILANISEIFELLTSIFGAK